jgi:hypothetical protein
MDTEFSCLFVATKENLLYLTLNGDIICEAAIDHDVIVKTAKCLRLSVGHMNRAVVCGGPDGVVWLAVPEFERKRIALRKLTSSHRFDVKEVIVRDPKSGVITVDTSGQMCVWSCVGAPVPTIRPELFRKCADCDKGPVGFCTVCTKVLCAECFHEHHRGNCPALISSC